MVAVVLDVSGRQRVNDALGLWFLGARSGC